MEVRQFVAIMSPLYNCLAYQKIHFPVPVGSERYFSH